MSQYGNANQDKIKRLTKARLRRPRFLCYLDGFGDVTNRLVTFDVNLFLEDSLKEPNYGDGVVTLSNADGAFVIEGAPSVPASARIRLWAGFEDELVPIWTGIVNDPSINTVAKEINLACLQPGIKFRRETMSGSLVNWTTPVSLVQYLCSKVGEPAPVFENEAGTPTTYTISNTWIENSRTFWALIHGISLAIGYVPYFDCYGKLNLRRRNSRIETNFVFDDNILKSCIYDSRSELINVKTVDFATSIKFNQFQFGDLVHPYQHEITVYDYSSRGKYGTYHNYETDELIGTLEDAKMVCNESLDWFAYRRVIYNACAPGIPFLELFDKVSIKSDQYNVHGDFIVIGRKHTMNAGRYTTFDALLSAGER